VPSRGQKRSHGSHRDRDIPTCGVHLDERRRYALEKIGIDEMAEVEEVQSKLVALEVPVSVVLPNAACEVIVKEVQWSDRYPRIVPRNGPEPGIVVDPAQIPDGHALLLTVHTMRGGGRDGEMVTVLYLIEGGPPSCVARIIDRPPSPPPPGFAQRSRRARSTLPSGLG
jgi:hypothetical protein